MKKVLSKKNSMGRGIGENSNTLFHYKKGIAVVLILISLVIFLVPIRVLKASDYKTGRYLKAWPIKHGEEFYVEYTHSVQLTPVIEIYYVDDTDNIVLRESYFYSYGAGLPATTPYKFEISEKGFRIYDINQVMNNLVYRTGAVKANHKINIRNKTDLFLSFSEPREGVKFTIEKIALLTYIAKEVKQ